MAIDFPNSPTTNDTYTVGNKTWIYDGTTWNTYNTTSFSAETLPGTTLKSTVTGSSLTSAGNLATTGLNVDSGTLYVDSTNNRVGVNDTTPSYDLDVNGTIQATMHLQGSNYLTPFSGYKNAIINGIMNINQRGQSAVNSSGYLVDRWKLSSSGVYPEALYYSTATANVDGIRTNSALYLRTDYQYSNSHYYYVSQHIEDVRTFSGQQVTLSFWATGAGYPLAISYSQNFGSGGSPSSAVTGHIGIVYPSGWGKHSITFTLPSVASKTIGTTANTSSLEIRFILSAGSSSSIYTESNNLGYQFSDMYISGVQLERGPVATTFDFRHIGQELALCQRYYETTNTGTTWNTPYLNITGSTNGFSEFITYIKFAVAKRTTSYTMTGYRYDTGASNAWWINRSGYSWTPTPVFDIKTINGCRAYAGSAGATWVACEAFPLWSCSDEF